MNIKNRDESIKQLSEAFKPEQLRKVIMQPYSDTALSVISEINASRGVNITDNRFSAKTINKLSEAYVKGKISGDDLELISRFAPRDNKNEPYIDDFLDSIDKGVYHETAAKVFAAVGYDKCVYSGALDLVRAEVYYPTDYAGLGVDEDVAKELGRMGYPLRACEGFNYCYDIDSADRLEGALERGAAITIPDKTVAVEMKRVMNDKDWIDFRNYIIKEMGDNMSNLTGADFMELRQGFERENMSEVLYNKVKAEYDKFILDMQKEPVGVAIESAYEIVWKDNITQYLENETPELSVKQYAVLTAAINTLDEIYGEWCSNGELHSYDDIGTALEDTANAIIYSLERRQQEREQREHDQPPVIPETKSEDISAPTEPKRKTR